MPSNTIETSDLALLRAADRAGNVARITVEVCVRRTLRVRLAMAGIKIAFAFAAFLMGVNIVAEDI